MTTRHLLIQRLRYVAVVLAFFANGATAQTARVPDGAVAFDTALLAYERNHWHAAFASLVQLADRGHVEAARMALQMRRFGPKLYQTYFSADVEQINRWTQLWGCQADTTSRACQVALRAP